MQPITFKEYNSKPTERDTPVMLTEKDFRLGETVGRITQLFIHQFPTGEYVIQEGSNIVWVAGNDGNPSKESVFRIPSDSDLIIQETHKPYLDSIIGLHEDQRDEEATYMVIETKADDLGRQRFWLFRWSDQVGKRRNEEGWFGQMFKASVTDHFDRLARLGRKVIVIDKVLN